MLTLALTLAVAAGPSAEPVRVLIDEPQARLIMLTLDQALSAGAAERATAEVSAAARTTERPRARRAEISMS